MPWVLRSCANKTIFKGGKRFPNHQLTSLSRTRAVGRRRRRLWIYSWETDAAIDREPSKLLSRPATRKRSQPPRNFRPWIFDAQNPSYLWSSGERTIDNEDPKGYYQYLWSFIFLLYVRIDSWNGEFDGLFIFFYRLIDTRLKMRLILRAIIIDTRSLLYRDRIISAIKRNRIVYTPIWTNMNKWIEMVKHDSQFYLPSVENNFFFRFEPRNTLYQDYTVPILTYARISHKGEINGEWRHFYRRSRSRCMRKVGRRNCSIN